MADTSLSEIGPVVLVGAGKMGLALARGWIAGGLPPASLVLVDPFAGETARAFAEQHGVRLLKRIDNVLTHVLVLAVKPQVMRAVCTALAEPLRGTNPLVISIAAGVRIAQIEHLLGDGHAIVRCMPNTPALVGAGAAGLCANRHADAEQRALAERLLDAAGTLSLPQLSYPVKATTHHRVDAVVTSLSSQRETNVRGSRR